MKSFIQDKLEITRVVDVMNIRVRPKENCRENECFTNCTNFCAVNENFHMCLCWILYDGKRLTEHFNEYVMTGVYKDAPKPGEINAEFHCIVFDEIRREFLDITPGLSHRKILIEGRIHPDQLGGLYALYSQEIKKKSSALPVISNKRTSKNVDIFINLLNTAVLLNDEEISD